MKSPNNTHNLPGLSSERTVDASSIAVLDLDEGAREVCRQMACFRAQYAQVDDTHTGQAWSLRDHMANARMRLDRLANVLALDVPVTGLEVEVARLLQERVQVLVHICEQRRDSPQAARLRR